MECRLHFKSFFIVHRLWNLQDKKLASFRANEVYGGERGAEEILGASSR